MNQKAPWTWEISSGRGEGGRQAGVRLPRHIPVSGTACSWHLALGHRPSHLPGHHWPSEAGLAPFYRWACRGTGVPEMVQPACSHSGPCLSGPPLHRVRACACVCVRVAGPSGRLCSRPPFLWLQLLPPPPAWYSAPTPFPLTPRPSPAPHPLSPAAITANQIPEPVKLLAALPARWEQWLDN